MWLSLLLFSGPLFFLIPPTPTSLFNLVAPPSHHPGCISVVTVRIRFVWQVYFYLTVFRFHCTFLKPSAFVLV